MLLILFIILLLIILLLLWLFFRLGKADLGAQPAPPAEPSPDIPDSLTPAGLTVLMQTRLAGTPADGSTATGATPSAVIWLDQGDKVLVHLDSLQISFAGSAVLIAIDLESDQSGRTPMVVALALGSRPQAGGALLAATDEIPRGNPLLAARWGKMLRDSAWSAFLALAADHAGQTRQAPLALTLADGKLHLAAGPAVKLG